MKQAGQHEALDSNAKNIRLGTWSTLDHDTITCNVHAHFPVA